MKARLKIAHKLFLLLAVAFTLELVVVIYQVDKEANISAHGQAGLSLHRAQDVLRTVLDTRAKTLHALAEDLAADSTIYPQVEAHDGASLQDRLGEIMKAKTAGMVMITDRSGEILARTDRPEAVGTFVRRESRLFGDPFAGKGTTGLMRRERELYQMAVVPVVLPQAPEMVIGTLAVGRRLDAAAAQEIDRLSGSRAAFVIPAAGEAGSDEFAVEASGAIAGDLARYLSGRSDVAAILANRSGHDLPARLTIQNAIYDVRFVPLTLSGGEPAGAAVVLTNRTAILEPYENLKKNVLLWGTLILSAGCLIAALIAEHISRPIGKLVGITRDIQEGVYPKEAPKKRGDEIGVLHRAIHDMGRTIWEMTKLEDELAQLSETFKTISKNAEPLEDEDESTGRELAQGTRFADRYVIEGKLGVGATGTVYVVKDLVLDDLTALKVFNAVTLTDAELERFKQEARLARRISHRNVLRTHDFGNHQGTPFISMEYIKGFDLRDLLTWREKIDVLMGVRLAMQLCSAVGAAHAEGIIHRDLKPENVMVTHQGIVKVMDFGIATMMRVPGTEARPGEGGMISGTPSYMAPEQFLDEPLDARADIYSLGAILYELLTGSPPFDDPDLKTLIYKHLYEAPPALRAAVRDAPEALESIVTKALAKKREDRYRDIRSLSGSLAGVLRDL